MKYLAFFAALACAAVGPSSAYADGELNIYNWGNYTNPDLIKKFEKTYNVKVTLTDYDSNDTALAKVKQGASGFDIVVPTSTVVPIWIKEGLLLESNPNKLSNFKNVDPKWVDVGFDPGRHYTVPYAWGIVGVWANTSVYKGDLNTSSIVFDPPPELVGKVNVMSDMSDLMNLAVMYVGGELCTSDKTVLKKVQDTLTAARPKWISIDSQSYKKAVSGDFSGGTTWSGNVLRMRLSNPQIAFGYPKEGFPIFMDNVAILKDAKNVENAKLFLNFIMDPENAALISAFTRFNNGIVGSEKYLPKDMLGARELTIPKEMEAKGKFAPACPPDVHALYTEIWTELLK